MPALERASKIVVDDLAAHAVRRTLPQQWLILSEGDECAHMPILIAGEIRVFKVGASGREITLYRFGKGESCILTANCVLSQLRFPALARVEQQADAVVIPAVTFREWIDRHAFWRDYVFTLLAQRLALVMAVVDEVAFRRVDARVADYLLRHTEKAAVLQITHQAIADEIGTSREVVSRILQEFATSGWIDTRRGAIVIRDRAALSEHSALV